MWPVIRNFADLYCTLMNCTALRLELELDNELEALRWMDDILRKYKFLKFIQGKNKRKAMGGKAVA